MIKLEVGKSYITRDGRNTGPMIQDEDGDMQIYFADGSTYQALKDEEGHTIVAEFVPLYTFTYRNWRGEVAERTVTPIRLGYAATDWHPEPQWLLIAWDNDKGAERSFAMKDINP